MTYTIWYKRYFFWHKIENVEGDTIIETDDKKSYPVRVFFLANKDRLEIPMEKYIIKFSKERFYSIDKNIKDTAGK